MPRIPIGDWFEVLVDFLRMEWSGFFDAIGNGLGGFIRGVQVVLLAPPFWLIILLVTVIAFLRCGKGIALFTCLGLILLEMMGLWADSSTTLALIITSTLIAIAIGLPIGILSAYFRPVSAVLRPILDLMQTMPAFVYLIPSVLFFGVGDVPAVISTIIFSMPPVIRLTDLGIRQVPEELNEAGESFGSQWHQMLFKIQLPFAAPTIMAGLNQCIMLSLSMVVIAAMIGASGLGSIVVSGTSSLNVGKAFEGGLGVVIIAIIIDRLTQGKEKKQTD